MCFRVSTITGGLADGESPNYYGGGIYLYNSNPILINVTITNNAATTGGGMYLSFSNSTKIFINLQIDEYFKASVLPSHAGNINLSCVHANTHGSQRVLLTMSGTERAFVWCAQQEARQHVQTSPTPVPSVYPPICWRYMLLCVGSPHPCLVV